MQIESVLQTKNRSEPAKKKKKRFSVALVSGQASSNLRAGLVIVLKSGFQ